MVINSCSPIEKPQHNRNNTLDKMLPNIKFTSPKVLIRNKKERYRKADSQITAKLDSKNTIRNFLKSELDLSSLPDSHQVFNELNNLLAQPVITNMTSLKVILYWLKRFIDKRD